MQTHSHIPTLPLDAPYSHTPEPPSDISELQPSLTTRPLSISASQSNLPPPESDPLASQSLEDTARPDIVASQWHPPPSRSNVPTLFAMATRVAQRNVAHITDLADMPWEIARPVLEKVVDPQQLRDIEIGCSEYIEHDKDLWIRFIKRDIQDYRSKKFWITPEDDGNWYYVYDRLIKQERAEKEAHMAELKASLQSAGEKKMQNEAIFVDKLIAEPRRRGQNSKQDRWATRKVTRANARSGGEVIAALRRESAKKAQGIASMVRQRKAALNTPGANPQALQHKKQIKAAPKVMVNDHLRARGIYATSGEQSDVKVYTPARTTDEHREKEAKRIHNAVSESLKAREEKLKALTNPQIQPAAATTESTAAKDAVPEEPADPVDTNPPEGPKTPPKMSTADAKAHLSTLGPLPVGALDAPGRAGTVVVKKRKPASLFIQSKKRKA